VMEKYDTDTMPQHQQWTWQQLSPQNLDHRVQIPTAITLHRLVPKTPTTAAASKHKLRHFKPEEVLKAQLKAKYKLLEARLGQENPAPPPSSYQHDTQDQTLSTAPTGRENLPPEQCERSADVFTRLSKTGDKKSTKHLETTKKAGAVKPSSLHRGIGESSLRIRQVTRLVAQISNSVKELESLQKQIHTQRNFITPFDNELKKRRWEEFLHSAGRSLFSLKREISLLERKSYIEDKNGSRYLRMLAVSTRTLHRILLALKTHAENAFVCASGKKLFVELTAMTHRLFSLVTSVGVRAPRLSAQVIQKGEHLSEDSSTEVVSSDIDSDALSILQPHLVRHRIATLARHRLKKKRRMKQKVTMQMPVTNKKDRIASETAVHLLQKNKGSVDNISEGPMDHSRVTAAASTRPTNNQSQASNIISSHDYKLYGKGKKTRDSKANEHQKIAVEEEGRTWLPEVLSQGQNSLERNADLRQNPSPARTNSPERSICNPKLETRYRTVDGHQLVEDTAEAVVNRLRLLFDQETQPKEDKSHRTSAKERERQREQEADVDKITQQIHYLLERVCKIEEERMKIQDILSEASLRIEPKCCLVDVSIETAIEKANKVMSTLGDSDQYTIKHNAALRSSNGIMFHNNNGIPRKTEESITSNKFSTNHHGCAASMVEEESKPNILRKATLTYPEGIIHGEESIKNQLQYQKEEFWASLVKRGFLKPREVTEIGTQDINNVVEMMMCQDSYLSHGNDSGEKKIRETKDGENLLNLRQGIAKVRKSLTGSNTKQQQQYTRTTVQLENKETQISSSSLPNKSPGSHHSLGSSVNHAASLENILDVFSNNNGACSGGEDDVSVSKAASSNVSVKTSGSHQSSSVSKSDGSLGFPSYDGVSNSE
ncbi:hypothetical protein OTU49_002397, partial [Cherax quadricarinatus]